MSTEPGYQPPAVTVSATLPKRGLGAAVLVVPVVTGDDDTAAVLTNPFLDAEAVGELEVALKALGAKGGSEQTTRVVVPSLPVGSVLAVGLGKPRDEWPADVVRRAAGVSARALSGTEHVVTALGELDLSAAIEGLLLGAYRFTEFRSAKTAPKEPALAKVTVLSTAKGAKAEAARATDVATAVATARDFVNTPPSHLYPDEFAKRARALGESVGLTVEVLDDKALEKGGYGGIIGVGKGSSRPPRLVRLVHRGGSKKSKKVALVGKGITFDTGGISIKPAANMDHMTSDMSGAAGVVAATCLAAELGLDVEVVATVPMAENMPSGTAYRPGDVLTMYGGTTVEVLNTDAEGRLILGDAIARACEDAPDYLLETSTLTGAQLVALGSRTPGVMGTDAFRDRVAAHAAAAGDGGWAMPLPEELRADLDSRVADLANVTNHRFGGMLVGGIFLREFVADGVPWVHLDIAGPAFNTGGPHGYTPKGGTGVPVRTIAAVLDDIARHG